MRNSGALRREVQLTNPIIESPPRGYGEPNPVIVGIETSLTTLHRYDFPNRSESTEDRATWEQTVRNNLAWIDAAKYDVLRIGVGDAATSLATEATEWDWLIEPTRAESRVRLFCTTPAFAEVETVKNTLQALPWKGVIAGESKQDDLNELLDACAENGIALYSGFSSYYGPKNEFMVGLANKQSSQQGNHWLDARAVSSAAPGAVRNLLFLLTLQFKPNGVFTHLSTQEHAYAWIMNTNTQDVRNWYTYLRGRAGERPIANIMFDANYLPVDSALAHYQRHFLATLNSGLGLAGYDIQLTKGVPIDDADLHIIVSEDGAMSDIAKSIVSAGNPVLWLPVRGIGSNGQTAPITEAFGLSTGLLAADTGPLNPQSDIDGFTVKLQTENSQDRYPSHIPLSSDAVNGEILAASDGIPIVIRKDSNAVFNGVALHPEAAFIIAQSAATITNRATTLQAPFNGYGVAGTRSAFLATGPTELRVRLHHDDGTPFENGTRIRAIRFSAYGNPRGREVFEYVAPFTKVLTEHELIIIEAMPS